MKKILYKSKNFLMNISPVLYYILQFSWGIIMNLAGFVGFLIVLTKNKITKDVHKPAKFGPCINIQTGGNWGGLSLGIFVFWGSVASEHTKKHEVGHTLQNIIFGPFMIYVNIASAIRWHKRSIMRKKGIPITENYDDVWYEGTATEFGSEFYSLNKDKFHFE